MSPAAATAVALCDEAQLDKLKSIGLPDKALKFIGNVMRQRSATEKSSNDDVAVAVAANAAVNVASDSNAAAKVAATAANVDATVDVDVSVIVEQLAPQIARANGAQYSLKELQRLCPYYRRKAAEAAAAEAAAAAAAAAANADNNGSNNGSNSAQQPPPPPPQEQQRLNNDALAVTTILTRKAFDQLLSLCHQVQRHKYYRAVTQFTQPAHLISSLIMLIVLLALSPKLLSNMHDSDEQDADATSPTQHPYVAFVYVAAIAFHFGAQLWMTFVSGLSLFLALPRHLFGQCQQVLFPRYYETGGTLDIVALIVFVKYYLTSWTVAAKLEVGALLLSALIECGVRLYMAPKIVQLMNEKYEMEKESGHGQEIGTIVVGALEQNPEYMRKHRLFRRLHIFTAISNVFVLVLYTFLTFCLAMRINIQSI